MLLVLPNHSLLTAEVFRNLCTRSVLIKNVYEIISHGKDLPSLVRETLASDFARFHRISSSGGTDTSTLSWSLNIESINKSLPASTQEQIRLQFRGLDLKGPIQIRNPDIDLAIVLEFSTKESVGKEESDGNFFGDQLLCGCFLGRVVAKSTLMKQVLLKYDLKFRRYIGPTSLDHTLTFLIANITRITSSTTVFDPFVGTASLLVAATHFLGVCFGSDIDVRVLKGDMYAGQGERETTIRNIWSTFDDYNLPRPEILRLVGRT